MTHKTLNSMADKVDQLRHTEVRRLLRKGRCGVIAACRFLEGLRERGALHDQELEGMHEALGYIYRDEKDS